MEEIAYMVCMRVDELDDPVTDSTTTACVECGDDVWISAASRKQMHVKKAMPVCSRCAKRIAQENDWEPADAGDISAEQFKEAEQHLRQKAIELGHPEWITVLDDTENELDAFDVLKSTAAMSGEVMENPGDDWGSMIIMIDYEGMTHPPVPLSDMLKGGVPKDMIAQKLIPGLVFAAQAERVLFGMSSWTVKGKAAVELEGAVSESPDRMEVLVLLDVTADGVQQMASADIFRDGISPPKLGEWQDLKPEKSNGLFVDTLVPCLQLVRTLRETT
jgi:hypothetical protein